ncbi:MAG: hypothetical protein JSS66_05460 [Armatimonadetes bacterium]|nr:hypothetical protein [Armatimonadota bacterium]
MSQDSPPERSRAPWDDDQVCSLRLRQACGQLHEYTYEGQALVPTVNGWCLPGSEDVVQDWARKSDTDWEWTSMLVNGWCAMSISHASKKRFRELMRVAKAKTCVSSRAGADLETPEGQQALAFGAEGVVYALELYNEVGGWFCDYIYEVCGACHIPEEDLGKYEAVRAHYLQWGKERGLLTQEITPLPPNQVYFQWLEPYPWQEPENNV